MQQLDQVYDQLPIISFEKRQALHDWLLANEQTSPGIWIRIFKAKSKLPSVTFHEGSASGGVKACDGPMMIYPICRSLHLERASLPSPSGI